MQGVEGARGGTVQTVAGESQRGFGVLRRGSVAVGGRRDWRQTSGRGDTGSTGLMSTANTSLRDRLWADVWGAWNEGWSSQKWIAFGLVLANALGRRQEGGGCSLPASGTCSGDLSFSRRMTKALRK